MTLTRIAQYATLAASASLLAGTAYGQASTPPSPVLNVYGPGGPLPAMKDAAAKFAQQYHVQVNVVGGPTPQWIGNAQKDADIVFSGSEDMMSDFEEKLKGVLDPSSVTPLYLRKAVILVRPGNPQHIRGLEDLLKPGHHILVVNGAGQQGLWEDSVAREGSIEAVTRFRSNITTFAANSGIAKQDWISDKTLDAWFTWSIWQVSNSDLADQVPLAKEFEIHRDTGVALTYRGDKRAEAKQFVEFLRSANGQRIFKRWGWEDRR